MKIALFTPTHEQSAIARVSALVCSSLQVAGHNVAIIATEQIPVVLGNTNARFVDATRWTDVSAVRQIVSESDIVLHQIGDHYPFHAGSVAWLSEIGGCVALHDFFLGDMFLSWIPGNERDAAVVLKQWYGLEIEEYYQMARSGRFVERSWPLYPLTEWICSQADGVIVHSEFGLPAVKRATNAPVRVLSLPYDLAGGKLAAPVNTSENRNPRDRTVRVLTFGRINPNKLCDLIVNSIAARQELRANIEFRVVGTILPNDRDALAMLARDIGVRITIVGEVDDDALVAELNAADVIACLRLPALESASASAVEGMLSGCPLIVVDTGFYASLPASAVFFLPERETQSKLTTLLCEIVAGHFDLPAMGAAARTYAEATFRADTYASALIGLGREAAKRRPETELDATYATVLAGAGMTQESPSVQTYRDDTAIFRL